MFWKMADTWYQRTHRLREYSEDDGNNTDKRAQARRLFLVMLSRMEVITQMAIKINTPQKPVTFAKGGIAGDVSNSEDGKEWIAKNRYTRDNGLKFDKAWFDEAGKIPFKH